MSNQYASGPASLFSYLSRSTKEEKPIIVKCTGCGSNDTKPVDFEFEMYECTGCGAVFIRQPSSKLDDETVSTS